MRRAQNRVDDRKFPVQEQEIITDFRTSAPGLHVSDCGSGIMSECLNMIIGVGKLKLRRSMAFYKKPPFTAWGDSAYIDIWNNFIYFFVEGKQVILGYTNNLDFTAIYENTGGDWRKLPIMRASVPYHLDSFTFDYYGPLSVLAFIGSNYVTSCVVDFGTAGNRIRDLGMIAPNKLGVGRYSTSERTYAVGIEYMEKNSQGTTIRSSGVCRTENMGNIVSFRPNFSEDVSITHVGVWRSDPITQPQNLGAAIGNPDKLYLLFEIPIRDFDGESHNYTNGAHTCHLSKYMNDFMISINNDTNASAVFDRLYGPTDKYDINLIPMEKAVCYSGNRLWGMIDLNRRLIWSKLAGTSRQEQRDPLSTSDLGLGRISGITSLNGDLYIFCERGVALIRESDPEIPPQTISEIGSISAKIFSVNGFGIFTVINDKLLFLDQNTREYSQNCRGFNLNYLMGELAKKVSDFEFCYGMLFFIADSRLFVVNLIEGYGISEFKMAGYKPERMEYRDGSGLVITYIDSEGNRILYLYNANFSTEENVDYHAIFAKKAVSGWVEHSDTSVYAKLTPGAVIGTQDICDGLAYGRSKSKNKTDAVNIDSPWEYSIPAGRFNKDGRLPIGKTIGVKVFVENPGNENYISQVKLTTITQTEVLNPDFNPNSVRV